MDALAGDGLEGARAALLRGGRFGAIPRPTAIAVVRWVDPPRPAPEDEKPKPIYAPGSLEWEQEQRRQKNEAAPG